MAKTSSSNRQLFIIASALSLFGLLMVYSASFAGSLSQKVATSCPFIRQLEYTAVAYLLMILLMFSDYHIWQKKRIVIPLAILSLLSLALVFTQHQIHGAHRWLRFGFVNFQPSEIAKLVLLLCMAFVLNSKETWIDQPGIRLGLCLILTGLFVGLIGAEPDLGQAICIFILVSLLLFVAGLRWRYIVSAVLLGVPSFYFFVWKVPYRRARLEALLHPSLDTLGAGWQALQAKIAVGSGGLLGMGFGNGQQKFSFLPEADSDFIYALACQELGFVGAILITGAFLAYFYCGMKIALRAPDRYGFHIGLGLTLMVVLQAFINILMVLAVLPTKGIALPFISRGGSSLLLNMMATGILLSISTSIAESEC
jgi:cell division protein FtsW